MASAKKLITAQLQLSAAKEFKGDLFAVLSGASSEEDISQFLHERYGIGSVGQLSVDIAGDVAQFKWILGTVVPEAEALHKEALQRARNRQYKEAIGKWVQAISMNPQDPDYYFNAGIAFFEEKNYQESIENLEQAIKLCPIYYKARLILGTVYLKIRKFEKAEQHLLESIYFSPKNALAILNLGAVYSILKRYDEGVLAFKKIIALSPDEPRAYFGLGKIYSIQGNIDEANNCFHKVIELDKKGTLANHAKRAIVSEPSSTAISGLDFAAKAEGPSRKLDEKTLEALYADAYQAFLFGDYSKAVSLYKKYVENKPKDDYVWFSLGESYLRNGKVKEAAAAFKTAIKIRSSKGLYYKQLAISYDYLQFAEKAISAAEQAAKLGKKDSIVYTIWGRNLLAKNKILPAIEKLENALRLNKANLNAEYYLALAYAKNKDFENATDHLNWIIDAKVKSPMRMKAEELLKRIRK